MEDTGKAPEGASKPPVCPVCGRPVRERCERTRKAGVRGGYRAWHRGCDARRRMAMARAREAGERRRVEHGREERMLRAWMDRELALEDLQRTIRYWNEQADVYDRTIAHLAQALVRQAILSFHIGASDVVHYTEPFRALCVQIGSDGMDMIADSMKWIGAPTWHDDPDLTREGAAPRTFMRKIKVPVDGTEADRMVLSPPEARTFTWKTVMNKIWREDNIRGMRGTKDPGPWRYR